MDNYHRITNRKQYTERHHHPKTDTPTAGRVIWRRFVIIFNAGISLKVVSAVP